MPFADYLLEWLDIVKVRVKATTFSSYEQMVKSVIEPYFRKKAVTLQGLEARHIQQFYSEKAENGQAKLGYSLSRCYSSGAEIRNENRPCYAECGNESGSPEKE